MSDVSTRPDRGLCQIAVRAANLGVHLTTQETKIIELLDGARTLVSKAAIIDYLWGDDPAGGPEGPHNNVAVVITRLRNKGFQIKAHWGVGYALVAWPEAKGGDAPELTLPQVRLALEGTANELEGCEGVHSTLVEQVRYLARQIPYVEELT